MYQTLCCGRRMDTKLTQADAVLGANPHLYYCNSFLNSFFLNLVLVEARLK